MDNETRPTDCPECGCNYTVFRLKRKRWWGGGEDEERQCDACKHIFQCEASPAPEPVEATYGVTVFAMCCPYCRSPHHRATRTIADPATGLPKTRYRKCDDCSRNFRETINYPADAKARPQKNP